MMDRSGIYSILNEVTSRIYVGSSSNIEKRRGTHWSKLRKNSHDNPALQSAWNKYGPAAFVFSVLEYVDDVGNLIKREQYWIDKIGSSRREVGYNLSPCAGTRLGAKLSGETRKAFSERAKRCITSEHLMKMCIAARTPEAIAKKIAAHKKWSSDPINKALKVSQIRSTAAIAKANATKTGRPGHALTPENKKKLKDAWNAQLPEIRVKISNALKGRQFTPEWRAKMSASQMGNKNASKKLIETSNG